MEDNLYIASTERLIAPAKKHQDEIRRGKIAFEHERPLVTEVIKDLRDRITDLEKIDSIKTQNDPEQFMREVAVNRQVCAVLRSELNKLEVKVKMFDKN